MPKPRKRTYFSVAVLQRGKYTCFPTDMLRYDCCHPASPFDQQKIDAANSYDFVIELVRPDGWLPTVARWESFGWGVTIHEGGRKPPLEKR